MIAVDTNVLVYAHREDAQWHDTSYVRLAELAEPDPVGHPVALSSAAIDQVEAWLKSPSLTLLAESEGY